MLSTGAARVMLRPVKQVRKLLVPRALPTTEMLHPTFPGRCKSGTG